MQYTVFVSHLGTVRSAAKYTLYVSILIILIVSHRQVFYSANPGQTFYLQILILVLNTTMY